MMNDFAHKCIGFSVATEKDSVPEDAGAFAVALGGAHDVEKEGCQACRRAHSRPTPRLTCLAWRCNGTLELETEGPDNYDLMMLDGRFDMIRPREHSAQIPGPDREELERIFKGDGDRVNTLVCTPTLELGVDIGALDSVLMRNVPPSPSNYWQRAGRAGRRHRMALILTYARAHSHDRPYFNEPLKLLSGEIAPPSFNLRNDVMVRKHVHAIVLTGLHRMSRPNSELANAEQMELVEVLGRCFPNRVREYLFESSGEVRRRLPDFSSLRTVLSRHVDRLHVGVVEAFRQGWPEDDARVVEPATLRTHIEDMGGQLQSVVERLKRRLDWAIDQMNRLDGVRRKQGTLDPEQDALRNRCDRYVKRLKGSDPRKRRDAEGFDDTNTYSVLAAEGCRTRWRTGSGIGKSCGKSAGRLAAPATTLKESLKEQAAGEWAAMVEASSYSRWGRCRSSGRRQRSEAGARIPCAGGRCRKVAPAITTHRFGLW